jgi:hypothetical protein
VTALPTSRAPVMIITGNRLVHFGKIADIYSLLTDRNLFPDPDDSAARSHGFFSRTTNRQLFFHNKKR